MKMVPIIACGVLICLLRMRLVWNKTNRMKRLESETTFPRFSDEVLVVYINHPESFEKCFDDYFPTIVDGNLYWLLPDLFPVIFPRMLLQVCWLLFACSSFNTNQRRINVFLKMRNDRIVVKGLENLVVRFQKLKQCLQVCKYLLVTNVYYIRSIEFGCFIGSFLRCFKSPKIR